MPNVSLARSKSASDLRRFRELMEAARKLMKTDTSTNASAYFQAAMAMVLSKRIYFVQA
jgi:hypothetical protein